MIFRFRESWNGFRSRSDFFRNGGARIADPQRRALDHSIRHTQVPREFGQWRMDPP
jgi:hypothetical protein